MRSYTVRKYVASAHGVMIMYPGLQLASSYDATRRDWFRKALENVGRIVVSKPYVDVGGAGYIVTVSQAVVTSE